MFQPSSSRPLMSRRFLFPLLAFIITQANGLAGQTLTSTRALFNWSAGCKDKKCHQDADSEIVYVYAVGNMRTAVASGSTTSTPATGGLGVGLASYRWSGTVLLNVAGHQDTVIHDYGHSLLN